MNSMNDILAAAGRLAPDDLRTLKLAIDRLDREARSFTLTPGGQSIHLTPIDEYEFYELSRQSIAIEEDLGFQIHFHLFLRDSGKLLNFAELYAALRALAGESRRWFDRWKGAFSFPFTLTLNRNGTDLTYLLEIHICKDSLYFPLRKVVPKDDSRLKTSMYYQPIPDEFSRDEINRFLAYFYGYLWSSLSGLVHTRITPFVRHIPATRIVFGFHTGAFFEEQYKSEEEFQAAVVRHSEWVERDCLPNVSPDFIA